MLFEVRKRVDALCMETIVEARILMKSCSIRNDYVTLIPRRCLGRIYRFFQHQHSSLSKMVLDDADMIRSIKTRLRPFQVLGVRRISLVVETETLIWGVLARVLLRWFPFPRRWLRYWENEACAIAAVSWGRAYAGFWICLINSCKDSSFKLQWNPVYVVDDLHRYHTVFISLAFW